MGSLDGLKLKVDDLLARAANELLSAGHNTSAANRARRDAIRQHQLALQAGWHALYAAYHEGHRPAIVSALIELEGHIRALEMQLVSRAARRSTSFSDSRKPQLAAAHAHSYSMDELRQFEKRLEHQRLNLMDRLQQCQYEQQRQTLLRQQEVIESRLLRCRQALMAEQE